MRTMQKELDERILERRQRCYKQLIHTAPEQVYEYCTRWAEGEEEEIVLNS
jgi:hypothetical protein